MGLILLHYEGNPYYLNPSMVVSLCQAEAKGKTPAHCIIECVGGNGNDNYHADESADEIARWVDRALEAKK